MARKVFFSFHYEKDIIRSCQVRNSWIIRPDNEASAPFWDKSLWEEAKKKNPLVIKRMINNALGGTSVTAVLIGTKTYCRPWVRYEIIRSILRGNGLLGIHIEKCRNFDGNKAKSALNPFYYLRFKNMSALWWPQKIRLQYYSPASNMWYSFKDADILLSDLPYDVPFVGNRTVRLSQVFPVYDWVDDGYNQIEKWIEDAACFAGR